jgi:hypothetical protein
VLDGQLGQRLWRPIRNELFRGDDAARADDLLTDANLFRRVGANQIPIRAGFECEFHDCVYDTALVRELVIVLSDLYLTPEAPSELRLATDPGLPGLDHVARYATRSSLAVGWREWLVHWLNGGEAPVGEQIEVAPPATVAAHVVMAHAAFEPGATSSAMPSGVATSGPAMVLPTRTVWMATPVHLVTGLTSLHLDRRGVLRIPANESATLAAGFAEVFAGSGFSLVPLDSGDFLLLDESPDAIVGSRHLPHGRNADLSEPARSVGENVADRLRGGASHAALRRLGAEIEMWLHEHPVNEARKKRGEPPVTGLWLWGAGPAPVSAAAPKMVAERHDTIAFGCDAYLHGLWTVWGGKKFPLPQILETVFGYPHAQRAVLVVEVGDMLHSNPQWTLFEALAEIDRRFIAPAVEALTRGRLRRLDVCANDRLLTLRTRDRFKFWRRRSSGLARLR